jgi:hypothetical protein
MKNKNARLEEELASLRVMYANMCERCVGQSELLSKAAANTSVMRREAYILGIKDSIATIRERAELAKSAAETKALQKAADYLEESMKSEEVKT